jgi:hypothetical protein
MILVKTRKKLLNSSMKHTHFFSLLILQILMITDRDEAFRNKTKLSIKTINWEATDKKRKSILNGTYY